MQKDKINKKIDNFFGSKPTTLEELVSEQLNPILELLQGQLNDLSLISEGKAKSISFDVGAIPSIPVSEIGWSDVRTGEKGGEVSGPQRANLINFLKNIEGADLKDKLSSLSDFYAGNLKFPEGVSQAEKISRTMSYLVFYKTLTTILTNFNPASAGFNFESFLAVLLNGQQVPTGSNTIADITVPDGPPISLKLYQEKSVLVEGSLTDLVNDLVGDPGVMQYIVCMKSLEGKGLEANGSISWWRFNFNAENVMAILLASKHPEVIQLPEEFFIDPNRAISDGVPKRATISPGELKGVFEKHILDNIEGVGQKLVDEIGWGSDESSFTKGGIMRSGPLKLAVDNLISNGDIPRTARFKVLRILQDANSAVERYKKSTGQRALEALKSMKFLSSQESVSRYAALSGEQKKNALRSLRGYLYRDQFGLNRAQVKKIEGAESIGTINIGFKYVQNMLDEARAILNESVFEIVSNIKVLTTSINEYFAGGLSEDNKAEQAITASNNVEGKTEELRQVGKES